METDKKLYLKIAVHDGKFTAHSGIEPDSFSPTFVQGIGWRAIAYDDGSIRCNYILRKKDKKVGEILFKVTKAGYLTLNKRLPSGELIPLTKGCKLFKWPIDGIIGLVTGGDGEPYGYFHKLNYEEFLRKHGISKVECQDPNQLYTLYNVCYGQENHMQTEKLQTDGIAKKVGINRGRTDKWQEENPGTADFELYEMWRVQSAKWVIITEKSLNNGAVKTLITMTDPSYLTGIHKVK